MISSSTSLPPSPPTDIHPTPKTALSYQGYYLSPHLSSQPHPASSPLHPSFCHSPPSPTILLSLTCPPWRPSSPIPGYVVHSPHPPPAMILTSSWLISSMVPLDSGILMSCILQACSRLWQPLHFCSSFVSVLSPHSVNGSFPKKIQGDRWDPNPASCPYCVLPPSQDLYSVTGAPPVS